jgi:PAS domain S-box-containing protein
MTKDSRHEMHAFSSGERAPLDGAAARFRLLAEMSRQFASTIDLRSLLTLTTQKVGEALGDGCVIRLLALESDAFDPHLTATYHRDPKTRAALAAMTPLTPQRVGEGITGKVAATGEPILVPRLSLPEVAATMPPEYRETILGLDVASILAVPLKARSKILGVLSLHRSREHEAFGVDDLELASDLAERAALAIDSAKLVEELRTANEALGRSESRFRLLAESGMLGIVQSNRAGLIVDANAAFLETIGYTRHDLAEGKIQSDLINVPDRGRTDAEPLARLDTEGFTKPWEKVLVRKDGSIVPVLVGVTLDPASGERVAFVLDLTEQRRAEVAMHESDTRKRAVMDAALDAIVLMDQNGVITDFNAAAERTFGYAQHEVVGRSLAEMLVPPSLREQHSSGLRRYLETGEARVIGKRIELTAMRKGGELFPAELAIVRTGSHGAAIFTSYIRDITERQKAAEAAMLRRSKEAAEEANTELEAFSYSVAHDLRAPLRAINGFSAAVLEDSAESLDAPAKANLERVTSAATRMAQLIDALLSLARLTRTEPRREPIDLGELGRRAIEQLRGNEPARLVDFAVEGDLATSGDTSLLRALLDNLLGNAWKFTNKQARATIALGRCAGDGVPTYFVRDNGAGFDMTYADKLFTPFHRLHSVSEFEGTGIGLATVQRIVRRHGGRVWAESELGRGTTFFFTLSGREERR